MNKVFNPLLGNGPLSDHVLRLLKLEEDASFSEKMFVPNQQICDDTLVAVKLLVAGLLNQEEMIPLSDVEEWWSDTRMQALQTANRKGVMVPNKKVLHDLLESAGLNGTQNLNLELK